MRLRGQANPHGPCLVISLNNSLPLSPSSVVIVYNKGGPWVHKSCVVFWVIVTRPKMCGLPWQMLELWKVRVDGGDGKERYGEGYSDIWAINRLHFKASSPQFCDHVSLMVMPCLALVSCERTCG